MKAAIGPGLAILSTAGVASFFKGAIGEAREAQKVGALTNNVIKQTGGVANISAKGVGNLATAISNKTGIDDEAIQSGSNLLLTFKNVRNEVGAGAKIFDRATQAAVDLSASGFGDLSGTSKQLGKALNDPLKGISALGRAGVTFSASQKKQIAGFVKANDLLSAQKIILKEVESQVGGSAAATATSGDKMRVAFGNLQEQVGTALLPVIDKIAKSLTSDVIPAFSKFVSGMQNGTGAGGEVASTLKDIWNAARPIGAAVLTIVNAFTGLPGASQKVLLLAAAALVLQNRFSGAVPSLQNFDRTAALATAKTVAMRGGALAAGVGLATLASSAGGAKTSLGSLATVGAGIATGFAVGGPWGAAIGGGVSVLSLFASRSQAAASAQDALDSAGKRVAATLNTQTGALTANSRAVAAKELADSGAFAAAKKMGISLRDVLDASLGNTQALYRVSAASEAWANTQAKTGKYTEKSEAQLQTLRRSIGATASSLNNQRAKIDQVNEAMGKAKDKSVEFKVTSPGLFGVTAGINSLIAGIDKAVAKSKSAKAAVGSNAAGTDNWRGGLTMVGEKGPELINLAKGAQVIPNNKIGDVGGSSRSVAGAAGTSPLDLERAFRRAFDGATLYINGMGNARLATAGA